MIGLWRKGVKIIVHLIKALRLSQDEKNSFTVTNATNKHQISSLHSTNCVDLYQKAESETDSILTFLSYRSTLLHSVRLQIWPKQQQWEHLKGNLLKFILFYTCKHKTSHKDLILVYINRNLHVIAFHCCTLCKNWTIFLDLESEASGIWGKLLLKREIKILAMHIINHKLRFWYIYGRKCKTKCFHGRWCLALKFFFFT